MMKSYKTIRVEKKEGIGYLSLNRPEVRNAFNQEMIDEIRDALSLIDKDEEIRVLSDFPDHGRKLDCLRTCAEDRKDFYHWRSVVRRY